METPNNSSKWVAVDITPDRPLNRIDEEIALMGARVREMAWQEALFSPGLIEALRAEYSSVFRINQRLTDEERENALILFDQIAVKDWFSIELVLALVEADEPSDYKHE